MLKNTSHYNNKNMKQGIPSIEWKTRKQKYVKEKETIGNEIETTHNFAQPTSVRIETEIQYYRKR